MIDRAELLNYLDGDIELLLDISNSFLNKVDSYLDGIKLAIHDKDSALLEFHAHTLKGVSMNFYDEEVISRAKKLECLGREKSFRNVNNIYMEINEAIQNLKNELVELCKDKAA